MGRSWRHVCWLKAVVCVCVLPKWSCPCVDEVSLWWEPKSSQRVTLVVYCSFMAPDCWLWFSLLIVIVDCDCLLLIVGERLWERWRKADRMDEQRPQRLGFGPNFCKILLLDPCPVRPQFHGFANSSGKLVSQILRAYSTEESQEKDLSTLLF